MMMKTLKPTPILVKTAPSSNRVMYSDQSEPTMHNLSIEDRFRDVNSSITNTGINRARVRRDAPDASFYGAFSRVHVVAQCFGVLPVQGVRGTSVDALHYRSRARRVIYAHVLVLWCLVIEAISAFHMVVAITSSKDSIFSNIGAATAGAVFYGNSCIAGVLFLRLARRWPHIMTSWADMEIVLGRKYFSGIKTRVTVITSIVMLLALTEHTLSMLVNIPELMSPDRNYTNPCPQEPNTTLAFSSSPGLRYYFKSYCCRSHQFIFATIKYRWWSGLLVFVGSKVATFIWNFQDLFVILISACLVARFRQLNRRILDTMGKVLLTYEWEEIREQFSSLVTLIRLVDDNISSIVLLSFCNNLYFICLQLLNGLTPKLDSFIEKAYFFGSFFFLVGRTVTVTLIAAGVNDESKLALPAIYNCSAKSYCVEVQRLHTQLAFDGTALTGMQFFSITRNFMLAVLGAVFTYEVVLLQFK